MFSRRKYTKLLIVDDNEGLRSLLAYMLKRREFEVDEAANGKEALKKIYKNKPDIILLDAMMPEMNGFELCRHLRKDKETYDISIIFCTAVDTKDASKEDVTFDDYIEKPFSVEKLCEKIDRLIKRRKSTHPET